MLQVAVCEQLGAVHDDNNGMKNNINKSTTDQLATNKKSDMLDEHTGSKKQFQNADKILVQLSDDEDEPTDELNSAEPSNEHLAKGKEKILSDEGNPKVELGKKTASSLVRIFHRVSTFR